MLDQPSDPDVTLHHVALYVSDLELTRRFYRSALGMEEIARPADFTFPLCQLDPDAADQRRHELAESGEGVPVAPSYPSRR